MKKISKRMRVFFLAFCVAASTMVFAATGWADTYTPNYIWYTTNPSAGSFYLNNESDFAGFSELVNGTADIDGDSTPEAAVSF